MAQSIDLKTFKADMHRLGYNVKITTNSQFKSAKVFHGRNQINAGNVLTEDHLARHEAFYAYKKAHKVRDGDWIVVF